MAKAKKTKPAKKKTFRRVVFWGVCLGVIGLLAFGPRILAGSVRPWLESRLSEESGFEVKLGGLSAGWLASATVNDIEIKTKSGKTLATLKQVQTEKNLLGLIIRDEVVGGIFFREVVANIPLKGAMLDEVKEALSNIDIRSGVLGQILNPDSFAILRLEVEDSKVNLLSKEDGNWENVASDLNATVNLDHSPSRDLLDITIQETPVTLNPELGDMCLKFVAPVLAGSLNLQGDCQLSVPKCALQVQDWKAMDVDGVLKINEASADLEAKLIRSIAQAFAEPKEPTGGDSNTEEQKTLNVKLAKNNVIDFSIKEGIVHHEGLAFGLPDVLPNMLLQSQGDVGFDSTLDFQLALEIPFEKMGESEFLNKMGSPALTVPITGTFEEPNIGIGDRQLVRGFVRDAVLGMTDDQVDVQPWLDKLAESGLLKDRMKRRKKKMGEDSRGADSTVADSTGGNTSDGNASGEETLSSEAGDPAVNAPNADTKTDEAAGSVEGDSEKGLLDRLRQRRQEAKENRARSKGEEEASEAEAEGEEERRRKFFGRRNGN